MVRNRVRRRLREIVRRSLPSVQPGWDLVVMARSEAAQASFEELRTAYDALIARARLYPADLGDHADPADRDGQA